MATDKKAYPLRISAQVLDAMQQWSNDELRSLNAQIEYVLREALRKAGRLKSGSGQAGPHSPRNGKTT
ncbi:MAG: Arc family DNA binding domain-containing protein [Xanthomonadaceae bacterium]|nr:Arc family DNA binding domain-containing protein [Xanthomonadaceae bacterium]